MIYLLGLNMCARPPLGRSTLVSWLISSTCFPLPARKCLGVVFRYARNVGWCAVNTCVKVSTSMLWIVNLPVQSTSQVKLTGLVACTYFVNCIPRLFGFYYLWLM